MSELIYRIELDQDAEDPRKAFDFYSPDEVEAWENGEVYGWIVESITSTPEHEEQREIIDSCWGYYGEAGRLYAIECAKECVESM